jgi:hypothetical protein
MPSKERSATVYYLWTRQHERKIDQLEGVQPSRPETPCYGCSIFGKCTYSMVALDKGACPLDE